MNILDLPLDVFETIVFDHEIFNLLKLNKQTYAIYKKYCDIFNFDSLIGKTDFDYWLYHICSSIEMFSLGKTKFVVKLYENTIKKLCLGRQIEEQLSKCTDVQLIHDYVMEIKKYNKSKIDYIVEKIVKSIVIRGYSESNNFTFSQQSNITTSLDRYLIDLEPLLTNYVRNNLIKSILRSNNKEIIKWFLHRYCQRDVYILLDFIRDYHQLLNKNILNMIANNVKNRYIIGYYYELRTADGTTIIEHYNKNDSDVDTILGCILLVKIMQDNETEYHNFIKNYMDCKVLTCHSLDMIRNRWKLLPTCDVNKLIDVLVSVSKKYTNDKIA